MNFISLDLELNGELGEITQIGMVAHPFNNNTEDKLSVYIDQPNVDFDQTLSNGKTLSNYLAKDFVSKYYACKVSPEEAQIKLIDFMTRHPTKYIVQWGRGDLVALANQFRLQRKHYEVVNVQSFYRFLYKSVYGKSKGSSLQAAYYSILSPYQRMYTSEEFHDALTDACATKDVFLQMCKLVRTSKQINDIIHEASH